MQPLLDNEPRDAETGMEMGPARGPRQLEGNDGELRQDEPDKGELVAAVLVAAPVDGGGDAEGRRNQKQVQDDESVREFEQSVLRRGQGGGLLHEVAEQVDGRIAQEGAARRGRAPRAASPGLGLGPGPGNRQAPTWCGGVSKRSLSPAVREIRSGHWEGRPPRQPGAIMQCLGGAVKQRRGRGCMRGHLRRQTDGRKRKA